jgi:hypothetical protein
MPQMSSHLATHEASHWTVQQNGSTAQTQSSHAHPPQPVTSDSVHPFETGQAPQSSEHEAQVSPKSQAPLPQHSPQSSAHVEQLSLGWQAPSPQVAPKSVQS